MAVVYSDDRHRGHVQAGHPERPARIDAFVAGLGDAFARRPPGEASRADLERVHAPRYLERVLAPIGGPEQLDPDTYRTPASAAAALRAAGAAIAAVETALGGEDAIAALRPPGHHALPDRAMGFCLLANGAIAVRRAQAVHGVGRVAVIDWDVHHGNGTEAVFLDDPTVLAVSLHQWPLWPGSGAAADAGTGAGRGTTLNVPLAPGTGHDAYLHAFRDRVLPVVERFAPELLVVACGLDAHAADPLAALELEDRTFGELAGDVLALCGRLRIGPPALVLEGGYDLGALRGGAAAIAAAYSATRRM